MLRIGCVSLFKIRARFSWGRKKIKILNVQKYKTVLAFSLEKQVRGWVCAVYTVYTQLKRKIIIYFSVLLNVWDLTSAIQWVGRFVYTYSIPVEKKKQYLCLHANLRRLNSLLKINDEMNHRKSAYGFGFFARYVCYSIEFNIKYCKRIFRWYKAG